METEKRKKKKEWWYSWVYLGMVLGIVYLVDRFLLLSRSPSLQIHQIKLHQKRFPPLPLRFRSLFHASAPASASASASFKILQVADLHYGTSRCRDVLKSQFRDCSDLNSTRFLRTLIQSENPDFIAFTGDNIFGSTATDAAESLFRAFGPAIESRLPWAAILGNHDQESTMNRDELMFFISLFDYSLSQINPSPDQLSDKFIDGFGNYNLRVFGPPGSLLANTTLLHLLFLDSGDRETVDGIRTYGWIKESQLRWISRVSQGFKVLTGYYICSSHYLVKY